MAVEECIKRSLADDSDSDDDAPIMFRRNPSSSKQSSAPKKTPPQKAATNGEASNSQKPRLAAGRPAAASPTNHSRHSSEKREDHGDDKKPLASSARRDPAPGAVQKAAASADAKKATKQLPGNGSGKGDPDSDDDRPLSAKFGAGHAVAKTLPSGSSQAQKLKEEGRSPAAGSSVAQKVKEEAENDSDDSEDERPLASRFQSKPGVSASVKSPVDSDDEKPLVSRIQTKAKQLDSDDEKPLVSRFKQNGSSKKDSGGELKTPKTLNKRPLSDGNGSAGSLEKKAKVTGTSASTKVKHESAAKKEAGSEEDDDDYMPISQRIKKSASSDKNSSAKKVKVMKVIKKKELKKMKKSAKNSKYSKSLTVPPGSGGGQKWATLEHSGVIFPPPYKPHGIKMLYNGQLVDLTPEQEEVATMFAVMKDTDYATKPKFIDNFMNDWRQILGKNHVIKKFELCDFTPIYEWHMEEKEKKKQMSTEEKKALKEEKLKLEEKYMWAIVDGVKEKVGNFRVEPPGLFRGRGEHPKMGKLKRRIRPREITINIGKDAPVPECPIPGERWKEIRHDNTVTWLAFWNDPINPKEFKYVFLAASSSLKGQSDKEKYEKARLLKDYIRGIRANYTRDFSSKDPTKRQISVATYLIDKLALRAGNEKDDDEADTVGCCTLKVENVMLVPENKLQFDFLGKDSIRYFNTVEVEPAVYKAIGDFRTAKKHNGEKKKDGDDLFDMLDTSKLNAHLKELMPGLTAKVFRTYNASITLDDMLSEETKEGTLPEKIAIYQSANKEVAIICNHQRSVSKSHDAQMSKLNEKIDELKAQREEFKVDLSRARKGKPPLKDSEGKTKRNLAPEALEKKLAQIDVKIDKMEIDKKIKDDLKTVALGTSKINYLDPRITVAWCKRHEVPIEKIFNKSLLAKFSWAMDVDPSFRF